MSISLCMIVKNEEAMLSRCLDSVRHIVDEIIIVDTGSTDKTIEIAKLYNAIIFEYEWDNSFANARNYAFKQASGEWILLMDADDEFEKEDTQKLFKCIFESFDTNAYFFRTLSYSGEKPDKNDIISNLNIRLIRNNRGYRFEGNIHEQIVAGPQDACNNNAIKTCDIRIYHYGYLNSTIKSKNKRERNILLINKELEKNPENPFMLFNLGNEYFAQLKFSDALKCYEKSYTYFEPYRGYSPKLIIRIVSCYEILGKTEEQFEFIKKGLNYYPNYTDLEFIRANTLLHFKKYLTAISAFKKCIKMGEAPAPISNLSGVGTFRPNLLLSSVYLGLGDCDKALRYCKKALKINPAYTEAYSQLFKILKEKNFTVKSIKRKLENQLKTQPKASSYLLLSDIFYNEHLYEDALIYIKKAERLSEDKSTAVYYKGVCLLYLKQYKKAYNCFQKAKSSKFSEKADFLSLLCSRFDRSILYDLCCRTNEYFLVFTKFAEILDGIKCEILADDMQTSQPFLEPIFNLLDILLKTNNYEMFGKSRQLLNLVSDDSVLLRLGKLYFKNGILKTAYNELERSIKLTGKIDSEAFDIMKTIKEIDKAD